MLGVPAWVFVNLCVWQNECEWRKKWRVCVCVREREWERMSEKVGLSLGESERKAMVWWRKGQKPCDAIRVCVSGCVECVCVCERERKGDGERERPRTRKPFLSFFQIHLSSVLETCAIQFPIYRNQAKPISSQQISTFLLLPLLLLLLFVLKVSTSFAACLIFD